MVKLKSLLLRRLGNGRENDTDSVRVYWEKERTKQATYMQYYSLIVETIFRVKSLLMLTTLQLQNPKSRSPVPTYSSVNNKH